MEMNEMDQRLESARGGSMSPFASVWPERYLVESGFGGALLSHLKDASHWRRSRRHVSRLSLNTILDLLEHESYRKKKTDEPYHQANQITGHSFAPFLGKSRMISKATPKMKNPRLVPITFRA